MKHSSHAKRSAARRYGLVGLILLAGIAAGLAGPSLIRLLSSDPLVLVGTEFASPTLSATATVPSPTPTATFRPGFTSTPIRQVTATVVGRLPGAPPNGTPAPTPATVGLAAGGRAAAKSHGGTAKAPLP